MVFFNLSTVPAVYDFDMHTRQCLWDIVWMISPRCLCSSRSDDMCLHVFELTMGG